jgi:hypothetical protein
LAGFAAGGSVFAETNSVHEGISGELSLALGIPFPGNGDRRQQRRAEICQTSVHLSFEQINPVAAIRFAFFFVQAACMIAMGVIAAVAAGS